MSGLQLFFFFLMGIAYFSFFVCLLTDECVPNKKRNCCHKFIGSAWLHLMIEASPVDELGPPQV